MEKVFEGTLQIKGKSVSATVRAKNFLKAHETLTKAGFPANLGTLRNAWSVSENVEAYRATDGKPEILFVADGIVGVNYKEFDRSSL